MAEGLGMGWMSEIPEISPYLPVLLICRYQKSRPLHQYLYL